MQVLDAHVAQIRVMDRMLGGAVAARFVQAREEAVDAAHRLSEGAPESVAPLLGVPFLAPTPGESCTEEALQRVRKAGAIWLGAPDGARRCGAAAMVAVGGAPFGLDAQTTFCGIVSHRPERAQAMGLSARTVDDAALLAAVLRGQASSRELHRPPTAPLEGRSVRAIVPPRTTPEARAAMHKAILALREHGAVVDPSSQAMWVLRPAPPCGAEGDLGDGPLTVVRTDSDPAGRPLGVQIAATRAGGAETLVAARVLDTTFGISTPVSPRWV